MSGAEPTKDCDKERFPPVFRPKALHCRECEGERIERDVEASNNRPIEIHTHGCRPVGVRASRRHTRTRQTFPHNHKKKHWKYCSHERPHGRRHPVRPSLCRTLPPLVKSKERRCWQQSHIVLSTSYRETDRDSSRNSEWV